ncbi:MAG: hypothetical protein Ctma_0069 [Catillopecten margaritatus gill symbiont]|uniref:Uncharacterized protein n=1 Tax=Catillopecten margaritatus gill symbiont TaxID=3083288 RepID=A0AAU6PED8_9GAMM
MIKFLIGVIVALALIGGAIQFKATDKDWSLVVDKEVALSSVKTGAIKLYDITNALIADFRKTEKSEEVSTPVVDPKK